MKAKRLKLRNSLMIGKLLVVFSLIGGCSKIDYRTDTEWVFFNGMDKTIEISSGLYPERTDNHFVLMSNETKSISLELPIDRKRFIAEASMTPFSYEGALILYDGIRYRLPGLFDDSSANLSSLCNALNYNCEKKSDIIVFSFVLDEAFLKEIQSYQIERE